MWDQVGQLHAHHGDVPAEVRLLKLTEEVGEAAEAFLGMQA
jgi:NTP pyrophosphatase (non-canonical NTP hydrolase)